MASLVKLQCLLEATIIYAVAIAYPNAPWPCPPFIKDYAEDLCSLRNTINHHKLMPVVISKWTSREPTVMPKVGKEPLPMMQLMIGLTCESLKQFSCP